MKEIPVLFENDFCVVLNKPSGLAVQGGEGVKTSLDSILSEKYPSRPLLVHRLDKDTSGLILVAKTQKAAAGFSALFAGREAAGAKKSRPLVKRYLGVCSGVPEAARGIIRLDLDVRAKGGGKVLKESETSYRVISAGGGEEPAARKDGAGEISFSLLELELGTGRTHQIRRHLAQSGFPLLGDDKYGNFSLNRELRKAAGLKHLLLHASRLLIAPLPELLPRGLDITAPLPEYFSAWIQPPSLAVVSTGVSLDRADGVTPAPPCQIERDHA